MEPIVTTIVTRDLESSFDLVTSFFMAKLSEAEKRHVGSLISDCADEASALGLNVQEKLFRFAEVLWGGAAIGTEEMAEACGTKTLALITGYQEQKKVNGHRASMSPEWQRLANSKREAPPTAVEAPTVTVELATTPPTPVVEAPAAPAVEASAAPVAPAVEAPATPVVEAPAVRRRQKTPASPAAKSAGRGRRKTT